MAATPMAAISNAASNTTDTNNGVSPLSSGDVLALVHTIQSEVSSDLSAFEARAQALADVLMSDLQGFGSGSLPASQSQSGSGTGGGSGGNGVFSSPSASNTSVQGSGSGIRSLVSDPSSGSGLVNGEVWLDSNGNGILDGNETGMSGITVNLDDSSGQTLMTTTTDAVGNYQFTVDPSLGEVFEIQVIIPSGDSATIQNVGPPSTFSTIYSTGYSDDFFLAQGGQINVNAGLVPGVGPVQPNVYTWNPLTPATDINASDSQNWKLNGVQQKANTSLPGDNATDKVLFNGTLNNNGINWDANFINRGKPFSSMTLGVGGWFNPFPYTGQQAIAAGLMLDLTGAGSGTSLIMQKSSSDLNLKFGAGSVFQVDAGGEITNLGLSGDQTGKFLLNGGSTEIGNFAPNGNSAYQVSIGTQFVVGPNASLTDLSFNPLTFTVNGLSLVDQGDMTVFYGSGTGATLIAPAQFIQGCYIDVNGGTLTYKGSQDRTDTFAVPVYVHNGGTFALTGLSGQPGGKLIVQFAAPNTEPMTKNASVYMTDAASSVQLSQNATLECDNDYLQDNGTLETMDSSPCTLQDGPNGALGTATIAGGNLKISALNQTTYGKLNVSANAFSFNGTYYVAIDAKTSGNNDALIVSGTTYLQAQSNLVVYVNNGQPGFGLKWIIIQDGQGNNIHLPSDDFKMPIADNPNQLNSGVDPNNQTQYDLSH